jgi:hypothetical protein
MKSENLLLKSSGDSHAQMDIGKASRTPVRGIAGNAACRDGDASVHGLNHLAVWDVSLAGDLLRDPS